MAKLWGDRKGKVFLKGYAAVKLVSCGCMCPIFSKEEVEKQTTHTFVTALVLQHVVPIFTVSPLENYYCHLFNTYRMINSALPSLSSGSIRACVCVCASVSAPVWSKLGLRHNEASAEK